MDGMRVIVRSATMRISKALFPPLCAGCRREVSQPGTVCGVCWSKLRFIERPYCSVLGIPFSHDLGDAFLSAEAIADPPPFRRARAVAVHDGVPKQMAHGLKYNDRTDLAPWMAAWMVRAGRDLVDACDVIVPVPLHAARFWSRRFNQSAELARAIARQTGKPFEPDALKRIRKTQQQVGLGASERAKNVRGAFRVPEAQQIHVAGRSVLLIDDVYTTGATVKAATRALLRGGASAVDVLTFSRVLPGN